MRSPLPKYELVRSLLQAQLQRESLPGAKLPSELELCRFFGVSRMTIQQALSRLEKAGVVRREQGRGTFYLGEGARTTRITLAGLLGSVMQHPELEYARVIQKGTVPAPPRVADQLRIQPHTRVVNVERVGIINTEPILLIRAWLPYEIGVKLLEDDEDLGQQKTLISILQEKYGIEVGSVVQTIAATLADPSLAPQLGVDVGSALLEVERTYYDSTGRPVNLSIACYRSDRYRFEAPSTS